MEESLQRTFQVVDTTATKKIFGLSKRIRAVAGGTSASKTVSILIWLIDYCQSSKNQNKIVTVVSESNHHLEKGAIVDFINIMKDRGYWNDRLWAMSVGRKEYTFGSNKLEFYSVDTYGKAHGPRRDVLFLNECNNLAYNIVDQLIVRTREVIWLDWNPTSEFWFYSEMYGKRDDLDFLTLTYKDNEALDINTVREIESHKGNKNWWLVYGEGKLGEAEGRIFTGWEIIDSIPHEARLERYGLDFGYSNDPTAVDAVYRWNGAYIIDEIIHQIKLSNQQIADTLMNLPKALIVADAAEPKSIDEIHYRGLNIIASSKGSGSVLQGIQAVQDAKIFITRRSSETLKEYRNYLWMTDKDGKIINEPSPIWNHHMDAIRYAIVSCANKVQWRPNDPGGVKPLYDNLPG